MTPTVDLVCASANWWWPMCRNPVSSPPIRLEELLSDPLIQLVMKADNVEPEQIEALFRAQYHRTPDDAFTGQSDPKTLSVRREAGKDYRSGVGIMLLDAKNRVFVGQRMGFAEPAWQMPQGGIESEESPRCAAFRELREEIGTDDAVILAESKGWLRYDYPAGHSIHAGIKGRWKGQQQKWFAMRFRGTDDDINVNTEHAEFSRWEWVPATRLPELIIPFKRQLYLDVLEEFDDLRRELPTRV